MEGVVGIVSSVSWEFWSKTDKLTELSSQLFCLPENAETRNNMVSLSNYLPLIRELISLMEPKLFCEIGVDDGNSTRVISQLSDSLGADYHAVDPTISQRTESSFSPSVKVFKEKSVDYLNREYSPDIYFIDGDHNYFTVISELRKIEANRLKGQSVLIFMDDVGWPFARRDMYYNKMDIPKEHLNKSSTGLKLSPSSETHKEYGLPLGQFYVAGFESCDKNGVLTAVEDFLTAEANWDFIKLPSLCGFGILWHEPELSIECQAELAKIKSSFNFFYSFLGLLEFNRINLLSKINQLGEIHQKEINEIFEERDNSIEKLNGYLRESGRKFEQQNLAIEKMLDDKSIADQYIIELKEAIDMLIADKKTADQVILKLQQKLEKITKD